MVDSGANLQATQHEDAEQDNLLHHRKVKSLNHKERHAQNYDVKPHVGAGYSSIISLQVEAFVCEGVVGIPDSGNGMALEDQAQNCDKTPRDTGSPHYVSRLSESRRCKYSTIQKQYSDFCHCNCERVRNQGGVESLRRKQSASEREQLDKHMKVVTFRKTTRSDLVKVA